MQECEVCGEHVERVTTCKSCGTRFCEDDGDPIEKLCIYCLEDEGNVDFEEPADEKSEQTEIDGNEDL